MANAPPIHDFSKDDEESIPLRVFRLERKSQYDFTVPHRHNYYEIFLFQQGGGTHFIDFDIHDIADKSIHFVSPGQVHILQRDFESFGYAILFSRDFYYLNHAKRDVLFSLPFLNNNSSRPILELEEIDFEVFYKLTAEMEAEINDSEKSCKEEIISSYLNIFLIRSKRYFEKKENKFMETAASRQFRQFRILLENNFIRLHRPSEYAEHLSITEKYLNELVKNISGKTVSELISDRIILEVKRLLLHSDLSFKEISNFLHFEDASYFAKFFKRNTGQTPSSFRMESKSSFAS